MKKVITILRKLALLGMEYASYAFQWFMKTLRIQLQRFKKGGARKALDKACRGLGAEIYAHHKQGTDVDWQKMPGAEQQLRRVEEAESQLLKMDESSEYIKAQHSAKKTEIREKFSAKRAQAN